MLISVTMQLGVADGSPKGGLARSHEQNLTMAFNTLLHALSFLVQVAGLYL
jgi:hypothetical protein